MSQINIATLNRHCNVILMSFLCMIAAWVLSLDYLRDKLHTRCIFLDVISYKLMYANIFIILNNFSCFVGKNNAT